MEKGKAWGPQDRETFTWERPAMFPVFNSITNNPRIGDERNFVRIRKKDSGDKLDDVVEAEVGQMYEIAIWIHNNASPKSDELGTALDVRLRVEAPKICPANSNAVIKGFISALNAYPPEVWDTAYLHTKEDIYLEFVKGSIKLHGVGWTNSISNAEDENSLFHDNGMLITLDNKSPGTIPSSDALSNSYVTFNLKVVKKD